MLGGLRGLSYDIGICFFTRLVEAGGLWVPGDVNANRIVTTVLRERTHM